MILDELEVIEETLDNVWLTRLRNNHFVWAVKQQRFAKIEWAWEPPDPGCCSGYLGIKFCWQNGKDWGTEHCQRWFIYPDGKGFDGKPLLMPVRNNCPDEPREISEPWQRQTERALGALVHRVDQLEALLRDHVIYGRKYGP